MSDDFGHFLTQKITLVHGYSLFFLSILCSSIILFYFNIYLDDLSNILILEFMDLLKSS